MPLNPGDKVKTLNVKTPGIGDYTTHKVCQVPVVNNECVGDPFLTIFDSSCTLFF